MEVSKRLSFGDVSLHAPDAFDSADVIQAVRNPTVESLTRALDLLGSAHVDRFAKIHQVAIASAPGTGELDLARIRKQFKSLKSNFVQFDVKEGFMDGLLAGRPCAEEGVYLEQLEQDIKVIDTQLKDTKRQNEAMSEELCGLIDKICQCLDELERKKTEVLRDVTNMDASALHNVDKSDDQSPMVTPDAMQLDTLAAAEAQGQEELAKAAVATQRLEQGAMDARTQLDEALLALREEEATLDTLEAEVAALAATRNDARALDEARAQVDASERYSAAVRATLAALGGVSLVNVAPNRLTLCIRTLRSLEATTSDGDDHTLTISFEEGTERVEQLSMEPSEPTMDLQQLVLHHGREQGTLDALVRRIQGGLLGQRKSRMGKKDRNYVPVIKDARFKAIQTDPRFQKYRKQDAQVEIDSRFERMFHDEQFKTVSAVDKRGKRQAKERNVDDMRRYYRLKNDKAPTDTLKDNEQPSKTAEELELEMDKRWARLRGLNQDDSAGSDASDTSEEESDLDPEAEAALDADANDKDAAEQYLDMVGGRDQWGVGVYAINKELERIPDADATNRLAIVDLDWSRVRAVDLLAALASFVPKGGRLVRVTVYPSDYGLERMAAEEKTGPQGIWKAKNQNVDQVEKEEEEEKEEDPASDRENNADVLNERLRAYEKSKMRWYYAIAEFDSVKTADAVYAQCDGMEFEQSANILDLRFVPDEQHFGQRCVRDSASAVPDGYEPPMIATKALAHTKVELTWDEDDPQRKRQLTKRLKEDEIKEDNFAAYLASSASESEDERLGEGALSGDPETRRAAKVVAARARYRALLGGEGDANAAAPPVGAENEGGKRDKMRPDADGNVVVTFDTGLETLGERLVAKKKQQAQQDDETVWEAYLRRRKEKRLAAKRKGKRVDISDESDEDEGAALNEFEAALDGGKNGPDDFFQKGGDGQDPFNDPFFNQEGGEFPEPGDEEERERKGPKQKQKRPSNTAKKDSARDAELELLLLDEQALRGTAHGAGGLLGRQQHEQEDHVALKKEKKRRKSGKERRAEEFSDEEDLGQRDHVNLHDPRFARLLSSHQFALDPTDPRFKDTQTTRKIIKEASKHRNKDRNEPIPTSLAPGHADKGNLKLLVANLKRKSGGGGEKSRDAKKRTKF